MIIDKNLNSAEEYIIEWAGEELEIVSFLIPDS